MALGFLPPGARGYIAGEQLEQQRQAQSFSQLGQLMQMQGVLQQQQQRQRALEMETAFRSELGKLGPSPDPQQAASIAMRFGKPDLAVQIYNQLETRKSREAIAEQNRIAAGQRAGEVNALRGDISNNANLVRQQISDAQIAAARERSRETNDLRRGLNADNAQLRRDLVDARTTDKADQTESAAAYAESLSARLRVSAGVSPRSTTGFFSPVVRGFENVANAVAPGIVSSDATLAAQTKEQLITVLTQMRGGGYGRLSNQDMRRIDTAIGQLSSGTPAGLMQGLSDVDDLIDVMRGKPARSTLNPLGAPTAPTTPISKLRKPLSAFEQ